MLPELPGLGSFLVRRGYERAESEHDPVGVGVGKWGVLAKSAPHGLKGLGEGSCKPW